MPRLKITLATAQNHRRRLVAYVTQEVMASKLAEQFGVPRTSLAGQTPFYELSSQVGTPVDDAGVRHASDKALP